MAARDDTTDSEGEAEAAKHLQRTVSPDQDVHKSVGVSYTLIIIDPKLSTTRVLHLSNY